MPCCILQLCCFSWWISLCVVRWLSSLKDLLHLLQVKSLMTRWAFLLCFCRELLFGKSFPHCAQESRSFLLSSCCFKLFLGWTETREDIFQICSDDESQILFFLQFDAIIITFTFFWSLLKVLRLVLETKIVGYFVDQIIFEIYLKSEGKLKKKKQLSATQKWLFYPHNWAKGLFMNERNILEVSQSAPFLDKYTL